MGRPTLGNASPIEISWESPPTPAISLGDYEPVIEEIQRNEGRWARVRTFESKTTAQNAGSRLRKRLRERDERWEVKTAALESQEHALYMRYRNKEQMKEKSK